MFKTVYSTTEGTVIPTFLIESRFFEWIAIVLGAVLIFFFILLVVLRKSELTKPQRLLTALVFALVAAPYALLLPQNYMFP